ncbi:hypothetical protein L7F22_063062 [Adiantum nelumboides]|nr:hypothetical protein [Adiantum nelumboides]
MHASEVEVVGAAKVANTHSFITSLPLGYQTHVGERGLQLSGDQKQCIAIAQAVLKKPTILLLDEATSALDAKSERVVQHALEPLMRGRTTFIVAHRLLIVCNADTIAVLQDGRVVEKGNHHELINKAGGTYSNLQHLQQLVSAPQTASDL